MSNPPIWPGLTLAYPSRPRRPRHATLNHLAYDPAGLSPAVLEKFPQLAGYAAFKIPANRLAEVPAALKGQLAVQAKAGDGTLIDATSLQIQGVLDDLYTYQGPLGATFAGGTPTLRVWAPTAVSAGALNGGQGNALKAKLNAALQKLNQGQTGPAASQVQAFINQVNDLVAKGILTADQGQDLIADAQGVLEAMG